MHILTSHPATYALLALAYVAALAAVLAVLTVAKRADEDMTAKAGEVRGPLEMLPSHVPLGRVAAEIADASGAQRVAMIMGVPDEPEAGIVGACLGAPPGLLGSRVPVERVAASGALGPAEAMVLGLAGNSDADLPWAFAKVPIAARGDEVVGTVALARAGSCSFTERDLASVERLATRGAHIDHLSTLSKAPVL